MIKNMQMKAITVGRPGGPEVLEVSVLDVPKPKYKQILIKIRYAGVNRPDILQRLGLYAPPKGASNILGLEASGTIESIGPGCSRWKIGDEVTALLPGGGYAEYAVTHEDHALSIPSSLQLKESAALCETLYTVWSNVFMRGELKAGETFLIHGGTSGIGTTAIQLASAIGARVFATAGTDEKCKFCESIGAHHAINYKTTDFVDSIKKLNNNSGINLILDMVGGDYISKNIKVLADDGRLVQIAFLEGARKEINFSEIMMRRLKVTGSTLRPQSDLAKSRIAEELRTNVWPLIDFGKINPVIDSIFSLEDVKKAHEALDEDHIGKILLRI
jgi:NADPH:quinone reductase